MKRMIKRTEITIETVEITTTRHTRRETETGDAFGNDATDSLLRLSGIAVPNERENEIEEKKEDEKAI